MRSLNLIGHEWSSDCIDLYFIFQWISVRIHEAQQNFFWYYAMLLCREMDIRQLLTLYFTLTQIFSGEKAKINLHMTLKFTVFMPISCLMRSHRHLVFFNFVTSTYFFSASETQKNNFQFLIFPVNQFIKEFWPYIMIVSYRKNPWTVS